MRFRLAAAALLSLAVASTASAATRSAGTAARVAAPQNLHGFLLRADEPSTDTFDRTPSFAWTPAAGATRYQLQLATTRSFATGSLLWSSSSLPSPTASIPVSLPWMTGTPYSLYVRVRGVGVDARPGPWSDAYGLNMRWTNIPSTIAAPPGLVRWTAVEGANAYEVWFLDAGKHVVTTTNAADEREYFTFHQTTPSAATIHWRVRAVRALYGVDDNGRATPIGMPSTSYGPWSPVYTSVNPAFKSGAMKTVEAISDAISATGDPRPHHLMPAFAFSGDTGLDGRRGELYRVYVATDRDCVNIVFRGAIVGGPAYAPRVSGPLALPQTADDLAAARSGYLADGVEGPTLTADGYHFDANEAQKGDDSPLVAGEEDSPDPAAAPAGGATTGTTTAGKSADGGLPIVGRSIVPPPIDLWDTDPETGRYFWTVVPVKEVVSPKGEVSYRDSELPQDACTSGRVATFAKTSEPALTQGPDAAPFASGLSPRGSLVSARAQRPVFYGAPLVSWQPALGATAYEVQWSKARDPFKPAGTPVLTFATSSVLSLTPGAWWYRVRGLNVALPAGARAMSWSDPVQLVVAKPTYAVVPAKKKR